MISDFDSHSHAQPTASARPHSPRSRFATHTVLKDEADPIDTRFLLFPSAQPAQAFPWFTAVLDGMSEPLSRYHE